jgi:hypothetical protein
VDLSSLEASRRLNRYQCMLPVIEGFGTTRDVPYFKMPVKLNRQLVIQP